MNSPEGCSVKKEKQNNFSSPTSPSKQKLFTNGFCTRMLLPELMRLHGHDFNKLVIQLMCLSFSMDMII